MGTYCKHHHSMESMLSDDNIITEITIPASCGNRLLLFVIQKVTTHGGKVWTNPACGIDGSIVLTTVTFSSSLEREKCCEEIEREIEKTIESQKPISIDREDDNLNLKFNIKFLFTQFYEIMKKASPVLDFIKDNGGWLNEETGQFPGFDALETARANCTLDEEKAQELHSAFLTMANFMGAYMIGKHLVNSEAISIVPHQEQ